MESQAYMKKILLSVLMGVALLAGAGREAGAGTTRGTLVTNFAMATFNTPAGIQFQVSYAVTAPFLVEAPDVIIWKGPYWPPTEQMPGGPVWFWIYLWNDSQVMTAYNVTLTDQLPDNTAYGNDLSAWIGDFAFAATSYTSSSADGITYTDGEPVVGQAAPYFMRWVLPQLGPNKSAVIVFRVDIL